MTTIRRSDEFLALAAALLPTLRVSVNFSASNGLFIDILTLQRTLLYGETPGSTPRLINVGRVNAEGEVYRSVGCIISGRVSSNPH